MGSRQFDDVDRLLRDSARRAVERLAACQEPVHPKERAVSIVYAHFHLMPVRARRDELIVGRAGYVRQLRAIDEGLGRH